MNILAFIVAAVLFVGSFFLFAYAFAFAAPFNVIAFVGGIVLVCVSLALPFHWLKNAD